MDFWFDLDRSAERGLQSQLKDQISLAIIEGRIAPQTTMPASRRLAKQLGVSRNTVVLAYSALQEDGYLKSRERSGFYVNPEIVDNVVAVEREPSQTKLTKNNSISWNDRLTMHVSEERNIVKPTNWRDYKYCFVYGQLDPKIFPVQHWRECWRDAVGVQEITDWSQDLIDRDDELLVEQIRKRILPRRGLWVGESQILVTVGAQNALFITLKLLLNHEKCFGLEDPGYPDARNIAGLFTNKVKPLNVDKNGLVVDHHVADCDVVFSTPGHQSPTTVTMPSTRRQQLLQAAHEHDFIVLEDDYEAETNYMSAPLPALATQDAEGRVIYLGSLSKTLAPGLRLGYLVGSEPFIREARALRRLIMRHPAANNQRAAAYFLSRGHHESLLRSLVRANKMKRQILLESLESHLPGWQVAQNNGGSSVWITGPRELDTPKLAQKCQEVGVLIEPGNIHFTSENRPFNQFRLGYTSIAPENIRDGVKLIAKTARQLLQ
ncbi:MAG: PLP-dependent aminotransferase family protein [Hyphomonadaceae bacterium]|nr:PLP-dependent aminotransferase family protein [Hyphomonadaceae bacterium]